MSCGEIRSGLRINAAGQSSQKRLFRDSVTDSSAFYNRLETSRFSSGSNAILYIRVRHAKCAGQGALCGRRLQHLPATVVLSVFHFPRTRARNTLPQNHPFFGKGIC